MHRPPIVIELQGVPCKGVPAGSRDHAGEMQQCPTEESRLQGAGRGNIPEKVTLQAGGLP